MWNIGSNHGWACASLLIALAIALPAQAEDDAGPTVTSLASALGFDAVDDSTGLIESMRELINGRTTMDAMKKRLIRLHDIDRLELRISQAANQNEVLVQWGAVPFFLVNYKKNGGAATLVEHGYLSAVEFEYVAIRGTRNYKAVLGSEHQAVVVEPINLHPDRPAPTSADIAKELQRLRTVYVSKECADFLADRQCVANILDDDLYNYVAKDIDTLLGRLHDKVVPTSVRRIRGLKFLAASAPISAECEARMKANVTMECLLAAMLTESPDMKQVMARRNAEIAAFRDEEGFQDLKWGSTLADVKRQVKGTKGSEESAQAQLKVGGRAATVRFKFAMKKLVEVEAHIAPSQRERDGESFRQLDTLLSEKYGEGAPQAAGLGERTEWTTPHSVIIHQLARGFPSRHTIVYRSIKLAPLLANLAKEQL